MTMRLYRLGLLFRCMLRAIIHGPANIRPAIISRVIVAPDGKIGDIVCGTPVLVAIRKNFPEVHIVVAGKSKLVQSILSDSGLVDEYLDLDEVGAVKRINACRADVGLITGISFEVAALFYLAGIPFIVAPIASGGFSLMETRPYAIVKRLLMNFSYSVFGYAPRERLRSLEPLGIVSENTEKHLGFSRSAERKIKSFFIESSMVLGKDFIVGISPAAGNKIKEWPEERFAKVADYLVEKHQAKIILIGGPSDGEKVESVKKHMRRSEVVMATHFDIDELKACIAELSLYIAVDTGPIYIAEAFAVPTVDIVGPMDERGQPPRGPIHRNVVPPSRVRPELSVMNARMYNKEEAVRQILSISVEAVIREVDALINDLKK